jgi:hypothetical protein
MPVQSFLAARQFATFLGTVAPLPEISRGSGSTRNKSLGARAIGAYHKSAAKHFFGRIVVPVVGLEAIIVG